MQDQKNIQKQGQEILDLLENIPENQLGKTFEKPAILLKIKSYFEPENKKRLPRVIGLFGGWGSGKTSLLSHITQEVITQSPETPVVYFNAWKYASTSDILPALIYKILSHPMIAKTEYAPKRISQMLISYIKDKNFRKPLFELFLSKEKVAAGETIWSRLKDIDQSIDPEILNHFFTSTDRNIKTIKNTLHDISPSLIIIDELDRCDPDEAYGLIKELKVLFGTHGLPLLFILSVNPEPIGMAIKNKYGFDREMNDYESIRILEKFVDVKFDITNDVNLYSFMEYHFNNNNYQTNKKLPNDVHQACYIFEFDHTLRHDYEKHENNWWSILNKEIFQLNNLRIISKCIESVALQEHLNPNLFWPTLHLELIKNSNNGFAKKLYQISGQIEAIAHGCYALFDDMKKNTPQNATFKYHNICFWEGWKMMINYLEGDSKTNAFGAKLEFYPTKTLNLIKMNISKDKIQFMKNILHDFKLMESVKHLTLVRVTENTNPNIDNKTYINQIFNGLGLLLSRRV